jgi:hypothetical protein
MSEQYGHIQEKGSPGQSAVVVEVGNENFEPGRTRAELSDDGRLVVTNRLSGDEGKVELTIEPSRARELVANAAAAGVAGFVSRASGIPDEPRYRIVVVERGSKAAETELWRSEVEEDEQLAKMVQELGSLVERASDGRFVL